MSWSWKIARVAGIDVHVHATFFVLLAWLAVVHWTETRSLAGVVAGVGFILALFGCVVLHEFGHALTARRYGIRTRDITLLPIGGIARLERMPEQPRHELWVALAGPAVNVAIAALLFGWLQLSAGWEPPDRLSVTQGSFVARLMLVNASLVVFNLLPAFPMDGGRALRAVLAMRMEYTRATAVAASIGQGMALLFGFLGLMGNPILVFIALFVWIGATGESSVIQMKAALAGIPVQRAMMTQYRTLTPSDTLQTAADLLLSGPQRDFPVVENGRLEGVLTREDLVSALTHNDRSLPVRQAMRQGFETAEATEMLETALVRLKGQHHHTLPVLDHGTLAGLITLDNIGEFLMIQAATRKVAPLD